MTTETNGRCKFCGKTLYRSNLTGICYRHPERRGQYRKHGGRKCLVCGTGIEDRNKSGRCLRHVNVLPNGDIPLNYRADQATLAWAKLIGPRDVCHWETGCSQVLRLDNTTGFCHKHVPRMCARRRRAYRREVLGPLDMCHKPECSTLLRVDNESGFCGKHHHLSPGYREKQRIRQRKHKDKTGEKMRVMMGFNCEVNGCLRFRIVAGPFCADHHAAWHDSFARDMVARSVQRFLDSEAAARHTEPVVYSQKTLEKMADALLGPEFTKLARGDAMSRAVSWDDDTSRHSRAINAELGISSRQND